MRAQILLLAVLASCGVVAAQNGPCTEDAVKTAVAKGVHAAADNTDDSYFFSGALDKPLIGKPARQQASDAIQAQRKNESDVEKPDRVVASASKDMAYEYGTAHITYDDAKTGKHEDFTSAYLRVWKAVGGSCKVAAQIAEPEKSK
jgi:ketosteroid isomerase-like protein